MSAASDDVLTPDEALRCEVQYEVAGDFRRGAEMYADRFKALRHGPHSAVVTEVLALISLVFAYESMRCHALGVRAPSLDEVCEDYAMLPRANLTGVTKTLKEAGN
jgi:hypothetical protein